MDTHNEVENILDRLKYHLSIVDVNTEFTLNSVMHKNTSAEAVLIVFIVPVSLVSDRNTVPAVGINMSKTFSTDTNNTFC